MKCSIAALTFDFRIDCRLEDPSDAEHQGFMEIIARKKSFASMISTTLVLVKHLK